MTVDHFPPLILEFTRDRVTIEFNNYAVKCSDLNKGTSDEWCSAVQILENNINEMGNYIVMGSLFLRNYYVIVDNQYSRIGFTQKSSELCQINSSDYFISVNDSNNLRLAVNLIYFIIILFITIKVTGGCFSFFDFGSSSQTL